MAIADIVGQANALIDQAGVILATGSAEEKGRVPQMLEDAKKLKESAIQLNELEKIRGEMKAYADPASGGGTKPPSPSANFKSWGEFLTSAANWSRGVDPRLSRFVDNDEKKAEQNGPAGQKDMTGQTGAAGGFLIPTEFQAQLRSVVGERSIVRPRATVIPMSRRQISIPVLDQTGTTAGLPHWFGGLRAYWTEEAGLKTASDATFRQVVLTAWKLVMFTRASDELLDDSAVSLAAFLSGELGFAGAIAWMEDYAFLQGTGAGQPLGVIPSAATISSPRTTASNIEYPDLTNMLKSFLPTGRGVWIISQSAMSEMLQLAGPTGNPSYIWGSAVAGAPATLLGYPVIWTEKTPVLGTAGDVLLCDFAYYLVGDRQATTIESTKFERWEYDETSWRAVHRVDGRPWLNAPLTLQDGTTTVSPFVKLAA